MMDYTDIQAQLKQIDTQINTVYADVMLKPPATPVQIVVVSKTRSCEEITAAIEAGQRVFGENKVQEALKKWPQLVAKYADLTLHYIGPLQTNKVKDVLPLFDVIETVDRVKLVDEIVKQQAKLDMKLQCYIQVNTGQEHQKSGIMPHEARRLLTYAQTNGLNVTGLMCIPPKDDLAAPHFALLYKMAKEYGLPNISMGMSADYKDAIAQGATHIRLGTAVFGERLT